MRKLFSALTAAAIAVTMFAGEANAQYGRRGGTGYDGGAQSAGQAHYFRDVYGRQPNYYKGGSGCMPYYKPPCYDGGCGDNYARGGDGGGYSPGGYNSSSSGFSVTLGGGYNQSRSNWGRRGGRSSDWGVGGSITFGASEQRFRPQTMEYRPSRDGYYSPQPLQNHWGR